MRWRAGNCFLISLTDKTCVRGSGEVVDMFPRIRGKGKKGKRAKGKREETESFPFPLSPFSLCSVRGRPSSLIPRHSRCECQIGLSHDVNAFRLFPPGFWKWRNCVTTTKTNNGVFRLGRLPRAARFSPQRNLSCYSQQTKPLLVGRSLSTR